MRSPDLTATTDPAKTSSLRFSDSWSRQRTVLIVLIVLASCVRVWVCFQHNPMDFLSSDALRHWRNGGFFPQGGFWGASDPIGYQAYISLVRGVTRDNRILVALACALLSVVMPWIYYRAARSLGLQKTPALWIWALIAWTPSLFTIYHYIMMETLLLAVDGLAIWSTGRYFRKGDSRSFVDSVICWTLACLVKPTVVPLAGVFALWTFWKKRPPLRSISVGALVAIVMLIPQAVRSKVELGFIAPFGNPWLTRIQHRSGAKMTYLYFHGPHQPDEIQTVSVGSPSCFMQPLAPLSTWRIRRAYTDSSVTIVASMKNGVRDWKEMNDGLEVSWDESFERWGENIVVFLFAPSWPESESLNWDSQLEFYTRWIWAPLMVIILGWNVRRFLKRRFELLPVAVTLFTLFLMLQNVATTEGRYRKPLEPLLLMNAVWLISKPTPKSEPDVESIA